MKIFYDTEFREKPNTIDFISIGMVKENGDEYYAVSNEFDLYSAWNDEWIRENVLLNIYLDFEKNPVNEEDFAKKNLENLILKFGKPNKQIASEIIKFIGEEEPELYGYYSAYDHVVFCWLFGRMVDLPKNFPMYTRDLKQLMDELELTGEWKNENVPEEDDEHLAISDAKWNKKLFDKIMEI